MKKILYGLWVIMIVFCFITCNTPNDIEAVEVYTVIFNLDGGNIDGNESAVIVSVNKGKTIENFPAPKKENCIFGGWFTESSGKGTEFTNTTEITSNVPLFAKWIVSNLGNSEDIEEVKYTVIFNLDGGNIDGNESAVIISVKQNETINDLPIPQRNPYEFSGWFTQKSGKGTNFTPNTVVKANISVFAKWTLINYVSIQKHLSDSRFNGVFTGTRVYSNINTYYDLKLTFDGTNKMV